MCPKALVFSALKDNTGESAISTVRKQWKTHLKLEAKSFSPLKTGITVIDFSSTEGGLEYHQSFLGKSRIGFNEACDLHTLGVAYHFRNLYKLTTHL